MKLKIGEKNLTVQMQKLISRVYSFKEPENKNILEPGMQQKTACSKILILPCIQEPRLVLKERGMLGRGSQDPSLAEESF